ncbi:MAG: hypothetical protein GWP10_15045 [Nitrospiraceae bacterium]|nr:hypothetical protein [Nitrospiraceae bacterium]
MKRRYYHFYPTCPNKGCHEPHRNEGVLEGDDETLCCVTCETEFRRFLNLNFSTETRDFLKSMGATEERLKKTRIFWGVEPNTVESEYIDWVCNRPRGQFMITWPWRDVRFLPVLAAEYALNSRKGTIVVVGRAMENGDTLSFPALDTVFENIMYLNEEDIVKNASMKRDIFRCIEKGIIRKSKRIQVQIRIIGAGKKYERRCYESTLRKCKNRIIKELDDEWGPDSIYRITIKKDGGNNKEEILNENATLDVTLTEMDKWSGKLEYLKDWELEVLSSSGDVHTPSSEMSYRAIRSPDDAEEDIHGVRIMFISEDLQPDVLFPFLEKSGANTVIFQDADNFIKDIIYRGEKSKHLMNFLKNNRESDMAILLFSSQPERRHLHSRFGDVANPLTIHTWDTEKRLEVLFRNGWSESRYSNPCFSLREFIPDHGQPPDMEYVSVDEMDDLFDKIDALLKRITWQDTNLRKDVIKYFKDLRKTPLFLAGDFTKNEVFSRKGKYLDLTFNSVMGIIEGVDEDVYEGMQDVWKVFSSNRPNKLSYLFDELLKLVTNEIEKMDSSIITFVVHPYDVKGFKKLLLELDGELGEYVQRGEITASPWSTELTSRCRLARDSGKKHTVISTEQPSLNFNIYSCDIDKVIFSGSKKNLDKIRDIVEKRITERFTRPVAFLREDDDAPTLLREIEEAVHDSEIVDEDDAQYPTTISVEEILLQPLYTSDAEKTATSGESSQHTICIMAGDDAVVAIGREGKIVLFPMDATLHFRKGGGTSRTEEIRISDDFKKLRDLKDVEISMSKDEIYRPLKVQFAEVMAKDGRGLSIETGVFRWDTFSELLYDAVAWILYLLEAKKHLEKSDAHGIGADDELARKIVGSGTSARDPAYVKMWWKGYEGEASTDAGPIRIPSVEHPRNVDDMKKIYGVINEIIPSINLSGESAIRSYSAAMVVQKVRRSVLKGSPEDISPPLKKVYTRLRPIMDERWEQSDKFHVEYFDKIKLKKDTPVYRVIDSSIILTG